MGEPDLALLLRIKGDPAGGKAAMAEIRAGVTSLRTSFSSEMTQIQNAGAKAFGSIEGNVTNLIRSVPGGNVFVSIAEGLKGLGAQSVAAEGELAGVATAAEGAGASVAAIAGPIGIAVLAIGAMAAGAALLVKELFSLAEGAADFRGKLFDLSQQTGISVETLSALEIVAKTTGGSLEGITASLGIFQKNLDSMDDATSKASKALQELGVSTSNTEGALRQTLSALSEMKEGSHQTALALDVFGRGGKSILAILKETQGDLDGTIEKLRQMGLIVSREDAEAADKFNDQLAILQFQFRALLGKEVIPAALNVLENLSKTLQDNKRNIDIVARALGSLATVVGTSLIVSLSELAGIVDAINKPYIVLAETLERVVRALERIGVLSKQAQSSLGFNATGGAAGINFRPDLAGGGEIDTNEHQPLSEREKENAEKAKKAAAEALAEAKKAAAERKRDLEGQLSFFEGLNKQLGEAADAYTGLDTKTQVYAVTQSIANGELKNAALGLQEMSLAAAANIDQIEKDIALQKELKDWREKQSEAARVALEGEKSFTQQAEEFIDKMRERGVALDYVTLGWIRFNAAILDSKKALDNYADALEHVQELNTEGIGKVNEDLISQKAGAKADTVAGPPPAVAWAPDATDAFGSLSEAISNALGLGQEGAQFFGDTLASAFSTLAQAVGESVRAFVLFGNAGGGIKKFTATLIAEIAKMAAVQAVWELAQGLAMLALNFFWPDPKLTASAATHFHAAAIYGGLAVVAAGVGRAVAGNSFNEGGGAGGSTGGASSSGRNASDRPSTVETNRNDYRPVIQVHLHGEAAVAFNYKVVDAVVDDHRMNGRVRVLTEGGNV